MLAALSRQPKLGSLGECDPEFDAGCVCTATKCSMPYELNPCGSGYTWDGTACTPTKDRIDTTLATANYIRTLQGAKALSLGSIDPKILMMGAAAVVAIILLQRR